MRSVLLMLMGSALLAGCRPRQPDADGLRADPAAARFELVYQHPRPILSRSSPGAERNKYGFEGGRVVRVNGLYHLFISEMIDDPKWARTRLAHWTSADGLNWSRAATLYESSGDYTGADPRAALFLPMPVFDPDQERWNLFYSAFRSAPNGGGKWLLNHDGRIWRATSNVRGYDGIAGPYSDFGVILEPGPQSDPWEGLQGCDSFFPFPVGKQWYAFYGSAHTQKWPCDFWGVGLAAAPGLAGPWRRCTELNPVLIDRVWVENPQVIGLSSGIYAAVYDATHYGQVIGTTFSADGVHWTQGKTIPLSGGEGNWLKQPRTPISLIPVDGQKDTFDVFFTGYDQAGYGCMSLLRLKFVAR